MDPGTYIVYCYYNIANTSNKKKNNNTTAVRMYVCMCMASSSPPPPAEPPATAFFPPRQAHRKKQASKRVRVGGGGGRDGERPLSLCPVLNTSRMHAYLLLLTYYYLHTAYVCVMYVCNTEDPNGDSCCRVLATHQPRASHRHTPWTHQPRPQFWYPDLFCYLLDAPTSHPRASVDGRCTDCLSVLRDQPALHWASSSITHTHTDAGCRRGRAGGSHVAVEQRLHLGL